QSDSTYEIKFEKLISQADDTVKAEELYNVGFKIRAEDPMLSFAYAKQLYQCALSLQNKKYEAKAYSLVGVLNYRNGELRRALEYHLKALEIREALEINDEVGKSYTNIGNVYSDIENFELSEKYHLKALGVFSRLNDEKQILNCLCNLGVLKHAQKQDTPAVKNFQMALQLAEKLNDHEARAMCCNNLGIIYEEAKNWDMALNYFFETVKLNEQMDTHGNLAESYFNLGSVYTGMKNKPEALAWLGKALDIAKKFEHTATQAMVLEKLAENYSLEGDYKNAFSLLDEKNKLNQQSGSEASSEMSAFVLPEPEQKGNFYENLYKPVIYFLSGVFITLIFVFLFKPKKKKIK
ncbi:MAG: tetratricopeptide repeat protein, partial [Bacteroidota bacterium]